MSRYDWDEKLATGDEDVDAQHRYLFGIINRLHDAILDGVGDELVARTIEELNEYIGVHFADEEALMQRVGYPGYEEQREQHADFAAETLELSEAFLSGTYVLPITLSVHIFTWLEDHVRHEDAKIAEWIRSQKHSWER